MQETLALQQGTILDDFLRTAAHADEGGDDDSHEEIADKVLIVHHRIAFGWRIAGQERTDKGQQRSFQQSNAQILDVGDLCVDVASQEDGKLLQRSRLLLV